HAPEQLPRVALTADDNVQAAERELAVREIQRRLGVANERLISDVGDDADDLELRSGRHQTRAQGPDVPGAGGPGLPDWIFTGPGATRERVVDQHDRRRVRRVARIEETAFDERHADDSKVVFVDGLVLRERRIVWRRARPAVDHEARAPCGV